jgi:hypothetical protein
LFYTIILKGIKNIKTCNFAKNRRILQIPILILLEFDVDFKNNILVNNRKFGSERVNLGWLNDIGDMSQFAKSFEIF